MIVAPPSNFIDYRVFFLDDDFIVEVALDLFFKFSRVDLIKFVCF